MAASNNREWVKKIIELYHSEPCLWKVKSAEYQDVEKKEAAYEKLIKKFCEVEPQADREIVLSKINILRFDYRKELEKVLATRSEFTGIESYEPDLWYFPLMRFLDNQEIPGSAEHSSELVDVPTASTSRAGISLPETSTKIMTSNLEHEDDFYDIFGNMVAIKCSGMSEEQRILAEKLMDEVLNKENCGKLT